MAVRAVVGLVVGVADALNFVAATGAGLAIASVNGHVWAEGSNLFREICGGFGAKFVDPESEGVAGGIEECLPFGGLQFVGERDGRKFGGVEDFVGVGVADAAEDARVGERAFERAIFGSECGVEGIEIGGENFQAIGIDGVKTVSPTRRCSEARCFVPASVRSSEPLGKSKAARLLRPASFAFCGRQCRRPAIIR